MFYVNSFKSAIWLRRYYPDIYSIRWKRKKKDYSVTEDKGEKSLLVTGLLRWRWRWRNVNVGIILPRHVEEFILVVFAK